MFFGFTAASDIEGILLPSLQLLWEERVNSGEGLKLSSGPVSNLNDHGEKSPKSLGSLGFVFATNKLIWGATCHFSRRMSFWTFLFTALRFEIEPDHP